MTSDASFGRWLSARRHLLDLTQEELARQVGCAVTTIRKLEADVRRPSKQIAERLAECLEITPADHGAFLKFARADSPSETAAFAAFTIPAAFGPVPIQRTNLTTPLTPLIGRAQDIAAVRNRLLQPQERFITLIGPPGIGKTRLAIAVANEVQDAFPNGVCFVALAPITDPDLVIPTIAQTLDVQEIAGRSLSVRLKEYLREKRILLILDNFEQVAHAAPQIVELLTECLWLKVIVTSRAALRVRGERQFPVPPLLLPDLHQLPPVADLAHIPTVALFLERAQAVKPDFAISEANAAAIATICVRLDGLPLAIELVAARVGLLPPQALLSRLSSRLTLLTDGPRDLSPRYRTLRDAIGWSYDLLDANEQLLFRRLGVFARGCSLEAAEAVCAADGDVSPAILDILAALVAKSLLRQDATPSGESRFTMLETIREYARERLTLSGELDDIAQRHADYYRSLAATAELGIRRTDQIGWLDRLEREHDNLRTAISWYHNQPSQAAHELELTASLWLLFALRCHYDEGRKTYRAALARWNDHPTSSSAYALALVGAGFLAMLQGDKAHGLALGEASLAAWRQLGNNWGVALALNLMGSCNDSLGHAELGVALLEESVTISRQVDDPWCLSLALGNLAGTLMDHGNYTYAKSLAEEVMALGRKKGLAYLIAMANMWLGSCAWQGGDYDAARSYFQESLARHRQFGDPRQCASALYGLGELAREQGDDTRATASYTESLALAQEVGDKQLVASLRCSTGYLALRQGYPEVAVAHFAESLALAQVHEFKGTVVLCLIGLAQFATQRREPERAARLLGAAVRLRDTIGMQLGSLDGAEHDRIMSATQAQLDQALFTMAWTEGQTMPLEQLIAEALGTGR